MKRAKKRILRRIVWIGMILMAAGFLTGCMETSEDDCIVKEKETETGDSIRSYSSGTEAVENVSVAEQVQAASPCMLSVEEGKIHVDLQASVYLPQGNSMKIYKAKTRYFTQEDMNGWIHILTQGQPLKNDNGDTIPWRAQQELTGTVKMTDPYASWAAAGKKVYQFEMQNLLEDGYKESGVSLRREECEYVPWSRDDSWQILHTKIGRKRMRKEADALLQTLGLAEEFHFMQSRAVYCTEDSMNENTGEETETGDTGAPGAENGLEVLLYKAGGRSTDQPEHRPQPVRGYPVRTGRQSGYGFPGKRGRGIRRNRIRDGKLETEQGSRKLLYYL